MKYPNLTEVYRWHPYSDATFADHAGITTRLFNEVIKGDEELTFNEMLNIERLIKMPVSALFCPKLIMLSKDNLKHRAMADKVRDALNTINEQLIIGDKEVKEEINLTRCNIRCENFLKDFHNNKVTYGRYIGIKEYIYGVFLSIKISNSKRNIRDLPIKKAL